MLIEGMAGHPFRLWDELPAILAERGIDFTVGTVLRPGAHAAQWDAAGCDWFSLDCDSARGYVPAAWRLAARSRAYRADVIQGTGPIAGFVAGLAGRLGARGLTVFHRQGDAFPDYRALTQLSRWAGRLSALTLACSESTARYAREIDGVPAARVRVAHNAANRMAPAPAGEVAAIRASLGIHPEAAVVSAVARLRPEKGLLTLLRALPHVATRLRHPPAVTIAGDGPCRGELARAADGIADVHLVGHRDDVAAWFSIGDVVAMPSLREPFGVAAVEAMMCERPLVASRVGGLTEVLEDGVSGLLVPPGDPVALGAAIAELLTDRDRAARIARAGRARALERFTNDAMVDAWVRAWSQFGAAG
jgi:glycosyltransferase involved in cell wall biosynthesis